MIDKPESHWKRSRFERFVALILKPFSPLIQFILGVSEEEIKAKQAKKAQKKAAKSQKFEEKAAEKTALAEKKAEEKAIKKAEKLEAKAKKQDEKLKKKSKKTLEKQTEGAEAAKLPDFFGPHPAQEEQAKDGTLEEQIDSKLSETAEALDSQIPSKDKGTGFFKKVILFATIPLVFFRYCLSGFGKISFLPQALKAKIGEDGFFAGIAHYFSDFRKKRQKKAAEKANNPRYKDPLGVDDEPLELLEFRSPTIAIVNTPLPPLARYIIWVMVGLISSMLLAMALLPLNKVVSLRGRLVSKRPVMIIQPSDQGTVLDIKAHVGDVVRKGQLLGVMDPRLSQADLEAVKYQVKIYQAQVDRLKAEIADRPYVPDPLDPVALEEGKNYLHRQKDFRAKLETIDETISGEETSLQGAEAAAAMYGSKLRIALELLRIRQAEQHHEVGTRLGTLQAQDAVMDTERQLIEAQKTANSARSALKGEKAKRESYLQGWKADAYELLAQTELKLTTAKAEYAKADIKRELINLRAPEDGIVLSEGPIARGAVAASGVPFMTLIPLKGGVEVEAAMTTEDSGYLKTGAHAIIKFASFPYDVYGGAEGTVSTISADSFLPDQAAGDNIREAVLPPGGKAGLFFRVKVQIDRYNLHGTPKFFHPGPGQVVTAEVDVGKRTMLRYMFGNVKANLTEGMREPS